MNTDNSTIQERDISISEIIALMLSGSRQYANGDILVSELCLRRDRLEKRLTHDQYFLDFYSAISKLPTQISAMALILASGSLQDYQSQVPELYVRVYQNVSQYSFSSGSVQ